MIRLDWQTASEMNNDHFTVQRSSDGMDFHPLADIKGAGTSNLPRSYSFYDEQPLHGVSYYRIRQTDFNGVSDISRVIAVHFDPLWINRESSMIRVYPNPVSGDFITVQIDSKIRGMTELALMDIHGKIYILELMESTPDKLEIPINKNLLKPGIYFLKISSDRGVYTSRFVVN
jgi:hypothetical protein